MDKNTAWHHETIIRNVARQLEKNNFSVFVASDTAAAVAKILDLIEPSAVVGSGGSQTVRQMEILERLADRGQAMLMQKPGMSGPDVGRMRRESLLADVFIASPNAITMDGKLVFVDKIGNRAAGIMFGPKKVIAVAGWNKIVADENAAFARVDNYAAPANARRLGAKTPCATTGICADCDSPDRICNIAVTLMKKPSQTEYHIILVPEELGY